MNRKQLIVLAGVLVLLIVARLVLDRGRSSTASHLAQAGVERVLEKELDPASIQWLRVSGPAPNQPADGAADAAAPAPLELTKSGEQWLVVSAEAAPADAKSVGDFISRAVNLSGELRGEAEAALPRFGLGPDAAVKLELGAEPGKPVATIWIGKQGDDPSSHFARAEGSMRIRHCHDGLRGPLQLWSDPAHPAADLFVNKTILEIAEKDLRSVRIERPDATFTLERGEAEPKAWSVSSPTLALTLQSDALDGIVSRAAAVHAKGVLPATTPACAPEAGVERVTFTRIDGGTSTLVIGLPLPGSDDLAVRLEGGATCYSVASFGITAQLPRASALWSIPDVFFEMAAAEPPRRIRSDRGGVSWELKRGERDTWSLASGASDAARCARVASAFHQLRVDDLAELARVPPAALMPEATLRSEVGGRPVKVEVLGERPGGLGERYVRVEGGTRPPDGWIAVLSAASVSALLPTLDDLRGLSADLDKADTPETIGPDGAP